MFVIETPFLNLDRIYDSNQNILRWIKLRNQKYIFIYENHAVKVEQQKGRLMFNCTDEEFYHIWFHHLDLGYDYMNVNYSLRKLDDSLKGLVTRSATVRIIKQGLEEVIVSSIIAVSINPNAHKETVELICRTIGKKHKQAMKEAGLITWYEFPSAFEILEAEDKLRGKINEGVLNKIISVCNSITYGEMDLDKLVAMNYQDAYNFLNLLWGITDRSAARICLYGLGHKEAFPQSPSIEEQIELIMDCDYKTFEEWYMPIISECSGLLKQYILYNKINPPLEEEIKYGIIR